MSTQSQGKVQWQPMAGGRGIREADLSPFLDEIRKKEAAASKQQRHKRPRGKTERRLRWIRRGWNA